MIPEATTASAQGVLGMVIGFLTAAATVVAGPLYEAWGGDAFLFMVPLPALALVILAALRLSPAGRRLAGG
jgi:hypothetical protein